MKLEGEREKVSTDPGTTHKIALLKSMLIFFTGPSFGFSMPFGRPAYFSSIISV